MRQILIGVLLTLSLLGLVVSNINFGTNQNQQIGQGGVNVITNTTQLATR